MSQETEKEMETGKSSKHKLMNKLMNSLTNEKKDNRKKQEINKQTKALTEIMLSKRLLICLKRNKYKLKNK